ncbi:EVE domain-containing protein [Lactiplantibacillus plantarum]|uniref:EVE domain-containing protein n=1 Tax=Lactiplantibacillus plantarum TaxID=1590 RepID=UPI0013015100|nr:EVE domain-containing protein [Lactiplantibacillus plantarum]
MKYWIGVVPKEYVELAVKENFCQVCNGKRFFISKMNLNDRLIYYSPKINMTTTNKYQKFIAVGTIASKLEYQVEMYPGFTPFRKKMSFETIQREVSLSELKDNPEWLKYRANLRFGHFKISKSLFLTIYKKMMSNEL